jgi:hypothetical protein
MARTLPQGDEILGFFAAGEEQKIACSAVLSDLQRHLVRCVEISDRVAGEINAGINSIAMRGFNFQSNGLTVSLPGVADLHSQAEAFLQSAKLAIRETAHLVKPFYGVEHDHRFHKFASWTEEKFGPSDQLAQVIRQWEPWVKHIVTMRNAVDHPNDASGGKLFTHNFRFRGTRNDPLLVEPVWGLIGGSESLIRSDMESIIEHGIQLGEEILVALFYKFKFDYRLVVQEIPKEQRNPTFPKRLCVSMGMPPVNR